MNEATRKNLADKCSTVGLLFIIVSILIGLYVWKISSDPWWIIPITFSIGAPLRIWGYRNSGAEEREKKLRRQFQ